MKRRDFIKVSSAAGVMGLIHPAYNAMAGSSSLADQGLTTYAVGIQPNGKVLIFASGMNSLMARVSPGATSWLK